MVTGGKKLSKRGLRVVINRIDEEIELRSSEVIKLREEIRELREVQGGLWELANGAKKD